jgi:protein ImuA
MLHAGHDVLLSELRERIQIPGNARQRRRVLPFGVPQIDKNLPDGGLTLGAVHEVAEGGPAPEYGAMATLFIAGILARLKGTVLWCLKSRDLFAPGLAGAGLHPDRVIYAETYKESAILAVMEEGLRHKGLAGVVGEVARLGFDASRRLQLAAESSGAVALVLRRWRVASSKDSNAAITRWRIEPVPSGDLPVPGVGRARWRLELVRVRGGEPAVWIVEACDAKGRLALSPDLADRSDPSPG